MARSITALLVGAAIAATPAFAQDFRSKKHIRVNPVNAAVFEVVGSGATRGHDYWCSAADYAIRALGADWSQRVYVARSLGPSATTNRVSAVQFTLDPSAAGISPIETNASLNTFVVGDSLKVNRAFSECQTRTTGI